MGLRLPSLRSALGADGRPSAVGRWPAFAVATLVLAASVATALTVTQSAQAATCSAAAVSVTSLHSPDGTQRPFYSDDFGGGTSNHSGYVGYELNGASLGSDVWIKLSGFSGGALGLAANQSASIPVRATSQAGHPLVYAGSAPATIASSCGRPTPPGTPARPTTAGRSRSRSSRSR